MYHDFMRCSRGQGVLGGMVAKGQEFTGLGELHERGQVSTHRCQHINDLVF